VSRGARVDGAASWPLGVLRHVGRRALALGNYRMVVSSVFSDDPGGAN
jgi:hypothetical protein